MRNGLIIFNLFLLCVTLTLAGVYPNFKLHYEFNNNNDNNNNKNNKQVDNDWWKTANFYQIYPRSFKDSDGDGVGDLKGITSKLSYLKEIGVTATWLSPIFKSPMRDFGYDIEDFRAIDPIFGTMDDFDEMIKEAKSLGVKIILDFVPNHSSNTSAMFNASIARQEPYTDFYVWHKGKPNPNGGRNLPPSNWVSVFRGSAWEWNDVRKEYYLHQFVIGQPDFNYRNPKVNEEMKSVLTFWLDRGVDGFRIDAVPHVFECPMVNGNYVDEKVREGATDPDDYGYLIHDCTVDQNETVDLVYDWRAHLDAYQEKHNTDALVLLTEQWSPIDIAMQYYDNGKGKKGSHVPFNFFLITDINNGTNAHGYAETINKWLSRMTEGRVPNWVLGNHDKNRVGSRLGTDRIDMLNMLVMTLPGVAVTYQGEEIGMTDVWISWEDTVDPQACNSNKENYERLSRDPARTPFQWNTQNEAGFTDGKKTWLPVGPNYKNVNVELERKYARSKLNVYKALRTLRNDPLLRNNFDAEVKAINDNVLGVKRGPKGSKEFYITLMNINDHLQQINLKEIGWASETEEYAIVTDRSPHSFGEKVKSNELVLLPKEAIVIRSVSKKGALDAYYGYEVFP